MKVTLFYKIIVLSIILVILSFNISFAIDNIVNMDLKNQNESLVENINIFSENEKEQNNISKVQDIEYAIDEKLTEDDLIVEYEYNENTNQVIARIISNIQLKDTKPTWKLSEDKLIYTKIFTENMDYKTPVEDIYGNIVEARIQINEIKQFEIKIKYEYNEHTNQVMAKIISNTQLKDTKPTWKLSEDKCTYIKTFTENMNYSTHVEDVYGNIININIDITQIKNKGIKVNYDYNKYTNQVTAKIISDIQLKNTKPTWKLSEDKLTYTKIFTNNMNYKTPVEDIYGNITDVNIDITQIQTTKIIVNYDYNQQKNEVIVKIISNIQLKDTKPTWKLSEDKLTYTKIFTSNMNYNTPIEDIYGNIIDVNINVTNIDRTPPEITIEYKYNNDDTVTVYMKSNKKLGKTKPTWILSNDKLIYSKTFDTEQNYSTSVEDVNGNSTEVKIEFKKIKFIYPQDDNSTIKVRYLHTDHKQTLVEIISSVKLQATKPTWTLSDDGYKYSKIFYENNIYVTPVVDINGVTKNVNIIVNLFYNYSKGIDVSAHQGKINWSEVKNSGIDFAIIRCGYGQDIPYQDDTYFVRNVLECERLGIPYGVYLYSYALTEQDVYSEVNHVLRLIRGHNPTYGVWIDMEDADGYKDRNGMPSNETLVNICDIFCQKIKENGYKAGVYASLNWLEQKLDDSKLDKHDKWVAQWNTNCSYGKKYVMWQYTSKGIVNGILTNVDMNIFYK